MVSPAAQIQGGEGGEPEYWLIRNGMHSLMLKAAGFIAPYKSKTTSWALL